MSCCTYTVGTISIQIYVVISWMSKVVNVYSDFKSSFTLQNRNVNWNMYVYIIKFILSFFLHIYIENYKPIRMLIFFFIIITTNVVEGFPLCFLIEQNKFWNLLRNLPCIFAFFTLVKIYILKCQKIFYELPKDI